MPESWYAVVVGGVVESVERRFEVACERAKAAWRAGARVVLRRATPNEVNQLTGSGLLPWIDEEDDDGVIPF